MSAPWTEAECGTACCCPQHIAVCARREWLKGFQAERVGTWPTPEPPSSPEQGELRELLQRQIDEASHRLRLTGRAVLETDDLRTTLTLDAQGRIQTAVEAIDRSSTKEHGGPT